MESTAESVKSSTNSASFADPEENVCEGQQARNNSPGSGPECHELGTSGNNPTHPRNSQLSQSQTFLDFDFGNSSDFIAHEAHFGSHDEDDPVNQYPKQVLAVAQHSKASVSDQNVASKKKRYNKCFYKCAVAGCPVTNKSLRKRKVVDPDIPFTHRSWKILRYQFYAPQTPDKRDRWIQACNLLHCDLHSKWMESVKNEFFICERHFVFGKPTERQPDPTENLYGEKIARGPKSPRFSYNADGKQMTAAEHNKALKAKKKSLGFDQKDKVMGISDPSIYDARESCKCVVRSCPIRTKTFKPKDDGGELYRFFRFPPRHPQAKEHWIAALKIADPMFVLPSLRYGSTWICERHFDNAHPDGNHNNHGCWSDQPDPPTLNLEPLDEKEEETKLRVAWADHVLHQKGLVTSDATIDKSAACSVRFCPVKIGSVKSDKSYYNLFKIPSHGFIRLRWIETLRRADQEWEPSRWGMYLCERHFPHGSPEEDLLPSLSLDSQGNDLDEYETQSEAVDAHVSSPQKMAEAPKNKKSTGLWCCKELPALKETVDRVESKMTYLQRLIVLLNETTENKYPKKEIPRSLSPILGKLHPKPIFAAKKRVRTPRKRRLRYCVVCKEYEIEQTDTASSAAEGPYFLWPIYNAAKIRLWCSTMRVPLLEIAELLKQQPPPLICRKHFPRLSREIEYGEYVNRRLETDSTPTLFPRSRVELGEKSDNNLGNPQPETMNASDLMEEDNLVQTPTRFDSRQVVKQENNVNQSEEESKSENDGEPDLVIHELSKDHEGMVKNSKHFEHVPQTSSGSLRPGPLSFKRKMANTEPDKIREIKMCVQKPGPLSFKKKKLGIRADSNRPGPLSFKKKKMEQLTTDATESTESLSKTSFGPVNDGGGVSVTVECREGGDLSSFLEAAILARKSEEKEKEEEMRQRFKAFVPLGLSENSAENAVQWTESGSLLADEEAEMVQGTSDSGLGMANQNLRLERLEPIVDVKMDEAEKALARSVLLFRGKIFSAEHLNGKMSKLLGSKPDRFSVENLSNVLKSLVTEGLLYSLGPKLVKVKSECELKEEEEGKSESDKKKVWKPLELYRKMPPVRTRRDQLKKYSIGWGSYAQSFAQKQHHLPGQDVLNRILEAEETRERKDAKLNL